MDANCASGAGFVQRLLATVQPVTFQNLWLTAANLLRFICWQHPLLLPLALFGTFSAWRTDPLVRALASGFAVSIIVMALLLPWQGHGWGYRYLHPVLGNAVLLACYGYHRLEKDGLSLQLPLILTTGVAVLLVALHGAMAARVVAPFAKIRTELASIPADVVIVDADTVPYGQDVVLNRFDLSNRPKLLIAGLVEPHDVTVICAQSTIAFYGAARMGGLAALFGQPQPTSSSKQLQRLREVANQVGCRIRD